MTRTAWRNVRSLSAQRLALAAALLCVSACAVSAPVTVRSTLGDNARAPSSVALALPDEAGGTMKHQFGAALQSAFGEQGVAISQDAGLIADYAISMGPADIGVQRPQDPQKRLESDPEWIAPPRRARRFDECEAQEMRGTLLILNRAQNAVAYRGQGTVVECGFEDQHFRELAAGLVADYRAKAGQ